MTHAKSKGPCVSRKCTETAGDTAQEVTGPGAKPNDLSLTPGVHMVGERTDSFTLSFGLHTGTMARMCHTQTQTRTPEK